MVTKKRATPSVTTGEGKKELMTVDITCPNCNFSTSITKEKIPEGARWATCPKCKQRFEFAVPESGFDPEEEQKETGEEGRTARGGSPWEMRSELGLWQGIYRTFRSVLFSPEKFYRSIVTGGTLMEPLGFGLLFGSIGTMFGLFWQFLMMWDNLQSLTQNLFGQFTISIIFLFAVILSPLFVPIGLFAAGGILHLCLLITGGGKQGFEGTFRVVSYSQATQIFGLIPFVGGLIGWFWNLIVLVIGLREIHETSYARVIVAFCIPLVPLLFLFLVLLAVVFLV